MTSAVDSTAKTGVAGAPAGASGVTPRATGKSRIAWLTGRPCPHQNSLLEAIAAHPGIELEVFFCNGHTASRMWDWEAVSGRYPSRVLSGLTYRGYHLNPRVIPACVGKKYDLFILTSYAQPTMQLAMLALTAGGRPWALLSERPGVSPFSRSRDMLRSLALFLPSRFASCLIGTGELARKSFERLLHGRARAYSLPYLVRLEPFLSLPPRDRSDGQIRFLFSGQLIHPKESTCSARPRTD